MYLVLVDGEASHIGTRGTDNAAQRTTDTATHVQHTVSVLDVL